jgi:hypothetical protein
LGAEGRRWLVRRALLAIVPIVVVILVKEEEEEEEEEAVKVAEIGDDGSVAK